jgi:hypothetical protein
MCPNVKKKFVIVTNEIDRIGALDCFEELS